MFKRFVTILVGTLMFLGVVNTLLGQESDEVDLSTLDFSQTRVSLAGPSAFFFRNVGIDGQQISIVFRQNADGVWQLSEVFSQNDSIVPEHLIFDFARLEALDDSTLIIDGLILDGKPYKAQLTIGPDMVIGFPNMLNTGSIIGTSLARVIDEAGFVTKDVHAEVQDQRDRALMELQDSLGAQERLEQEMTGLEGRVDELSNAASLAKAQLETARADIRELEKRNSVLEEELEQARAAIAAASDGAAVEEAGRENLPDWVGDEIGALEAQVSILQEEIGRLQGLVQELEVMVDSGADIQQQGLVLHQQITELQGQLRGMTQGRNDLEQELIRRFGVAGYLSIVKGDFNETVHQGFSGGNPVMGSWRMNPAGYLSQTDPDQFFARYDFPLEQRNESLLYRIQARSLDSGWVGYGIHLYTDNSRLKGYGFGEGLLVWVTRDPEVYGTNRTYIEVYRSRDDVDMERVLHAAISESIEEFLDIEILYEPEREYITMSVNGEEKVRYKTWFDVNSGVNTALRSLGRAEFRNLTVRSR